MSRTLHVVPSELPEVKDKPWALILRQHDLGGTSYQTLTYLSDSLALEVIEAGSINWLYGPPDWDERARKRALEKARVLREQAQQIEESNARPC